MTAIRFASILVALAVVFAATPLFAQEEAPPPADEPMAAEPAAEEEVAEEPAAEEEVAEEEVAEEEVAEEEATEEEATEEEAAPAEEPSDLDRAIDRLSLSGIAVAVYQYAFMDDDYDDLGRGAFSVEPVISYQLSEDGMFLMHFGFGAGNGLAAESPFTQAPWKGDVEDDFTDINGRNRDHFMRAWYRHSFALGESEDDGTVAVTGGITDSTDYVDGNAYANSELTQFMNSTFVNSHAGFLPAYDLGVAVEADFDGWYVHFVGMEVGDNGQGRSFHYYGIEGGITIETDMGTGNYRLLLDTTTEDFLDPAGNDRESLMAISTSCDQQLSDVFGVWIRAGVQQDDAAIAYRSLLSGGVNINGTLWDRETDEIGIGLARLGGGNLDYDVSHVLEVYGSTRIDEHLLFTLDIQYQSNGIDGAPNPKGWVLGARFLIEF
ncbi:MAG: carbohydrate porin [Planctomycetota bacterium]